MTFEKFMEFINAQMSKTYEERVAAWRETCRNQDRRVAEEIHRRVSFLSHALCINMLILYLEGE